MEQIQTPTEAEKMAARARRKALLDKLTPSERAEAVKLTIALLKLPRAKARELIAKETARRKAIHEAERRTPIKPTSSETRSPLQPEKIGLPDQLHPEYVGTYCPQQPLETPQHPEPTTTSTPSSAPRLPQPKDQPSPG